MLKDRLQERFSDSNVCSLPVISQLCSLSRQVGHEIHKRYTDTSIGKTFAFATLVLILISSFAASIVVVESNDILMENTNEELKQSTQSQLSQTTIWLNGMERQTRFISESGEIRSQNETQISTYLSQKLEEAPKEVVAIHYADSSEQTILQSTSESSVGDSWDKPMKSDSKVESVSISPTHESRLADGDAISFSSPVPDSQSKFIVIVVDLSEASLQITPPDTGKTVVATENGTILMSSNPGVIGANVFEKGYTNKSFWSESGTQTNSQDAKVQYSDKVIVDGDRYVTTSVHGTENDWVVMTQVPVESAFYLSNTITDFMFWFVLAIVSAATVVAGGIAYDFFYVIGTLKRKAERVRDGDYNTTVESSRGDEFGALFGAVGEMRDELEYQLTKQEQQAENMEDVVSDHSKVMEQCADGDLTVRMDTETGLKEFDKLGENFNEMVGDLEKFVREAKEFSGTVSESTDTTTEDITDLKETSSAISDSVQKITRGANDQSEQLDETTKAMQNLSAAIEEVSSSATELANQAEETAKTTDDGKSSAQDAAEAIQEIESQADETVDAIRELNRDVENIIEVVDFIRGVADKTQMLAINAGIEASRSDNSGEGFEVIADEIKTLSDDVAEATDEIDESLTYLQNQTEETAEDIQDASDGVAHGTETIEQSLTKFDDISTAVESTTDGVKHIDEAASEQSETTEEVVAMVSDVDEISKDTASQAETVAEVTEEQTASISEISENMDELSDKADTLAELLNYFNVSEKNYQTTDG